MSAELRICEHCGLWASATHVCEPGSIEHRMLNPTVAPTHIHDQPGPIADDGSPQISKRAEPRKPFGGGPSFEKRMKTREPESWNARIARERWETARRDRFLALRHSLGGSIRVTQRCPRGQRAYEVVGDAGAAAWLCENCAEVRLDPINPHSSFSEWCKQHQECALPRGSDIWDWSHHP